MKLHAAIAMSAITLGMFGCAAESATEETGASEGELTASLGADATLRCDADTGKAKLALIKTDGGKTTLVSLTPASDVYSLSRSAGTLTASSSKWAWKATGSSLAIGTNMKGTWEHGSQSTKITCKMAPAETASWRAANALATYGDEIDGLASTVLDEMQSVNNSSSGSNANSKTKTYTVFAVETAKRGSLDLGTVAKNTAGKLPAGENDSLLDENDFGYGGMSAAYSCGGGDDYGEWFQGASDGISLLGDIGPALGTTKAGFIAHEKVGALTSVTDTAKPSALEITVGTWTFFLPDAFAK